MFKVAAILKVSRLKTWINKPIFKEEVSAGLRMIKSVYLQIIKEPVSGQSISIIAPQTPSSALSATSDNFFPLLQRIFNETETENSTNTSNPECTAYILERELDAEILNFTEIISESTTSMNNSNSFWKKHSLTMPKLTRLYLVLSNIPAASTHIERYFNITGLINDKRRMRMKDDLLIIRSMLKVNMSLVCELSQTSED